MSMKTSALTDKFSPVEMNKTKKIFKAACVLPVFWHVVSNEGRVDKHIDLHRKRQSGPRCLKCYPSIIFFSDMN